LVGATHNGERKEMLMLYECGGFDLKKDFASGHEPAHRIRGSRASWCRR
jgi:hypothetical protein